MQGNEFDTTYCSKTGYTIFNKNNFSSVNFVVYGIWQVVLQNELFKTIMLKLNVMCKK